MQNDYFLQLITPLPDIQEVKLWLLMVSAAEGPRTGAEHLRLRSQFGIGTGCSKGRMII